MTQEERIDFMQDVMDQEQKTGKTLADPDFWDSP